MFSKFKELFGSENLLDSAYTTTLTMLEFDRKMYEAARTVLREQDNAELPFDIKKSDQTINKYEREVRRNVLTHLTIAGTHNLVPGLALVSIVIDVERIGDYTKNIVDLAVRHPKQLKAGVHEKTLQTLEETIARHFPQVISVMREHNEVKARAVMMDEQATGRLSDAAVADLISDEDHGMNPGTAVGVALYIRYLKRINAHLTNIASSMVNPFPRIGFREDSKE